MPLVALQQVLDEAAAGLRRFRADLSTEQRRAIAAAECYADGEIRTPSCTCYRVATRAARYWRVDRGVFLAREVIFLPPITDHGSSPKWILDSQAGSLRGSGNESQTMEGL